MSDKKKLPVTPGKYRISKNAFKGESLARFNGAPVNVKDGATVGKSGSTVLAELAGGGGGLFVGQGDVEPAS